MNKNDVQAYSEKKKSADNNFKQMPKHWRTSYGCFLDIKLGVFVIEVHGYNKKVSLVILSFIIHIKLQSTCLDTTFYKVKTILGKGFRAALIFKVALNPFKEFF